MTVAIDASSPPIFATFSSVVETNPFNPPAGSVLAAVVFGYASGGITMSNNGTSLTWTLQVSSGGGSTKIYTATLSAARTGMTVTASGITGGYGALKVYVLPGGNLTTPAGATGTGTSSTNNVTVNGYTSTVAGSRGICGAWDANDLGAPTSTDDEEAFDGGWSGMAISKAANTSSAGTTVTFNLDAFGSGTPSWDWAALEIVPQPDPPRQAVHVRNITAAHRAATW